MGQAQWAGIVCRLGPGLGLTPALNMVHPSLLPTPLSPVPKQPCNGTPGSPSAQPWKTVTDPHFQLTQTSPVQLNPEFTVPPPARVPYNPVYLNTWQVQLDTKTTLTQTACAQSEVLITTIKT